MKYLTGLINVPKLGQEPPNLIDGGGPTPDLPKRPTVKSPSPPPNVPSPDAANMAEQIKMLKEYEDQQSALVAAREGEQQRQIQESMRQQLEFEDMQRQQAERERLAREQFEMQQQHGQQGDLERELFNFRGQYERDQLMLEQYDRVSSLRMCISSS